MLSDLRHAVRTLRRSPLFAMSAILALALGVGANTAVFSVVYAVLLKPLPYEQPDRLVRLSEVNRADGVERGDVSAGTFVDWRARARTLEAIAIYGIPFDGETLWTLGDHVMVVKAATVSPAIFSLLRVQPILGRTLRGEQEPVPAGALGQFVISYPLWQRAFGGASDVVGRTVMIEGRFPREIVGVMPRGFSFPEGTEAWTSLPMGTVAAAARRARSFQGIARLAAHATIDDARRELDGLSAQLASEQPASNAGWTARVDPLGEAETADAKPALLALMAAVAGVLLIGCANVANLLLARATARRREMAVRMMLGAGTARLIRHSLVEAGLLCVTGVAVGLVLARWLAGVLVRLAPPDIPRLGDVGVTGPVFLFAAAAGLLSAGLTGLAPALQTARADAQGDLRPDGRSATPRNARVRRQLLAAQVAIVVVLVTGALLLVRTFVNLRRVDLGFETEHVVEVETRWPVGRILQGSPGKRPWPQARQAVEGLVSALEQLRGIEAVGIMTDVPLSASAVDAPVWRADAPGASGLTPPADPHDRWKTDVSIVSAGYFSALNIPFMRGRNFTSADRLSDAQLLDAKAPRSAVCVVNATFASRYFSADDPVGRTIIVPQDEEFGSSKTIVGVVADVRGRAPGEAPTPAVFIPVEQHAGLIRPSLVVRSSLPFNAMAMSIRARIAAYDPQLLVLRMRPMDALVSSALSRPRFNLLLVGSFAVLGLLLAAIGIYGVVSFLVAQRTREIGIRMALGARAPHVVSLVMIEGMIPVLLGGLAGMAAGVLVTRALRTLLFGVTPLDPISLTAAPLILTVVALLACYLPARHASHVDPLVALRAE